VISKQTTKTAALSAAEAIGEGGGKGHVIKHFFVRKPVTKALIFMAPIDKKSQSFTRYPSVYPRTDESNCEPPALASPSEAGHFSSNQNGAWKWSFFYCRYESLEHPAGVRDDCGHF